MPVCIPFWSFVGCLAPIWCWVLLLLQIRFQRMALFLCGSACAFHPALPLSLILGMVASAAKMHASMMGRGGRVVVIGRNIHQKGNVQLNRTVVGEIISVMQG